MFRSLRFSSAVSAIVLVSMTAGCAAPQEKVGVASKSDDNVGLAMRAMIALNANQLPTAIAFAERAVAKSPNEASLRTLLGNVYLAAGRFASAEAAYKDSLTISSNQPRAVLKLALAETALGKKDEAIAFLHAGRSVLDASNYGLALALAGQTNEAIEVLDDAARQPGADATVRQNLALAHALAGDWTEARTIAAQDVPGNQLDARIQQWMLLASPKKASDQVAAIVGVTPAAVDQGEPVQLALRKSDTMLAQAAPASSAEPVPALQPQIAEPASAPVPAPVPQFVQAVAAPAPEPQPAPAIAVAPPPPEFAPAPVIAQAASLAPLPVALMAAAVAQAPNAFHSFMPKKAPAPAQRALKARRIAVAAPVQRRNPGVVMQIGSYGSPQQVNAGWSNLTQRFPALRAYLPLRARFQSNRGTFWRLSVQGFESERDAIVRCNVLRSRGGHCFVRGAAGDAPVQIASR